MEEKHMKPHLGIYLVRHHTMYQGGTHDKSLSMSSEPQSGIPYSTPSTLHAGHRVTVQFLLVAQVSLVDQTRLMI